MGVKSYYSVQTFKSQSFYRRVVFFTETVWIYIKLGFYSFYRSLWNKQRRVSLYHGTLFPRPLQSLLYRNRGRSLFDRSPKASIHACSATSDCLYLKVEAHCTMANAMRRVIQTSCNRASVIQLCRSQTTVSCRLGLEVDRPV